MSAPPPSMATPAQLLNTVYQGLQEEEPYLLEPHVASACRLKELEAVSQISAAELNERLAKRLGQHKVVVDMVNAKVKENYSRFVEGMNKIQEVGACSDQTTRICDDGKTRLRMAKEGMVTAALQLAKRQQRKANLQRVRQLAVRLRAVAKHERDARLLEKEGRHAEAVLSMLQGKEEAEGCGDLAAVRALLKVWDDTGSRLYRHALDRAVGEACKNFNSASFELTLTAITKLGMQDTSASSLVPKWRQLSGLMTLAAVRPFALKSRPEQEVVKADPKQLIRMLHSDDVTRALLELLSHLAHLTWSYRAMLSWLQGAQPRFRPWHDVLVSFKAEFWRSVQDRVADFLNCCHLHSLSLTSFFHLVISCRMFSCLGEGFGDSGDGEDEGPALPGVLYGLTVTFFKEVFHREAIELTRMGLVHEECDYEDAKAVKERYKQTVAAIPDERDVSDLCRIARDFGSSFDPHDNPFTHASAGGGLSVLIQEGNLHSLDDLLDLNSPESQKILRSSWELIVRMIKYDELMDAFPQAARDISSLLLEIAGFYTYCTTTNFCGEGGTEGTGGAYAPERDPHLPADVRQHMQDLKAVAARLVPKDVTPETGEQRPFAPPAVQSRAVVQALGTPHALYGVVQRSAAMASVSRVVAVLLKICAKHSAAHPEPLHEASRLAETMAVMSKAMIQRVSLLLFPLDHYQKIIAESKWEPRTVLSEPSVYVLSLHKDLRGLAGKLSEVVPKLPPDTPLKLWSCIVENIWFTLVEGYSRVKKCSNEGRALMTLDMQYIQDALKKIVPGSVPSTDAVDEYIKAFYMEPDQYLAWAKSVHQMYTTKQLTAMHTINTSVIDRKRKDKVEAIKRLEDELQRLEHRDRNLKNIT